MTEKEKARDLRMVFFVRTDLDMPTGKIAAQVGHAVADLMLLNIYAEDTTEEFEEWLAGHSVKITLGVDDATDLVEFKELGDRMGWPTSLVVDKGFTCFDGKDTLTVVGWGPIHKLDHHNFTSHLKLL